MNGLILLVFGTVFAAVVLGIIIGRLSVRTEVKKKIDEAFEQGREEAEVEKANIALELGHQLIKMRDSIQMAAEAYENTVQVVRDRLATSVELRSVTDAEKKLLNPGEVPLALRLEKPEVATAPETAAAAHSAETSSDAEPSIAEEEAAVDEKEDEFAKRKLDADLERGDLPIQ
ncbi:MAG: hypothetical protein U0136_16490 [Bdellovibrionota bacterium]